MGTTGPNRPAQRHTAGPPSTSRLTPATDSAAQPTKVRGSRMARTAPAASSNAPAWGGVTNSTTKSGAAPTFSSTCPATSPVAWAVTGCSEIAEANGTASYPTGADGPGNSQRRSAGTVWDAASSPRSAGRIQPTAWGSSSG